MFHAIKNHAWVIPHIEKSIKKMRESDIQTVRSHANFMDVKSFQSIFHEASYSNQTLIFSFTPNLEENCVKQLRAYQTNFKSPDFIIYNINRHHKNQQAGWEGLLTKLNLQNLFMLSDDNSFFHKTFKFPYVKLDHFFHPSIWFLPRTTIVVKPDMSLHVFMLPVLVSDEMLRNHIQEIEHFINTPKHKHHGLHT